MCGIAGWVGAYPSTSRHEAERTLRSMGDVLRHRGPDDSGFYLDEHVALGHRRLSIIDLDGGHQPMWSADGAAGIVFNGEIYNFLELRPELERKGYRFQTRSDTEVLLYLYLEYGEGMLGRLNGMFSFALWDARRRELFVARDRMGKKPFYYVWKNGTFLFASELKALLKHPLVSRDVDRVALTRYLAHEYIPAPHSIFQDIRKLPGGCALKVSTGGLRIQKYWPCPFGEDGRHVDEREVMDRLRELLRDAVAKRLISDVPLGVFLSGGIDSSTVVAMMAELVPPEQIKTFSIGFKERSYDESRYARAVADHFGTRHHEEVLHPRRMLEILPDVVERLDEPFADPSIVPTYLLSELTRRHVTVALGGDGGDELFAGYPTFLAEKIARWYEKLVPPFLHRQLEAWVERWPPSLSNFSLDFKAKRFLAGIPYSEDTRHQVWMSAFYPEMQAELWNEADGQLGWVYRALGAYGDEVPSRDALQRSLYVYYKGYLQDDILAKVDRASMMHSLEVRAPFLDVRVVEYVSRLPARLKLRGKTTKYILKKAMRRRLPDEVLYRPKKGFGIPTGKWFRQDLRGYLRDVLSEKRIRELGFFNPQYVSRLVEEHISGKRDWRKPLWALFMFELWRERWLA
jgi:asparagine synthase (glutamine-hydrolysing)